MNDQDDEISRNPFADSLETFAAGSSYISMKDRYIATIETGSTNIPVPLSFTFPQGHNWHSELFDQYHLSLWAKMRWNLERMQPDFGDRTLETKVQLSALIYKLCASRIDDHFYCAKDEASCQEWAVLCVVILLRHIRGDSCSQGMTFAMVSCTLMMEGATFW